MNKIPENWKPADADGEKVFVVIFIWFDSIAQWYGISITSGITVRSCSILLHYISRPSLSHRPTLITKLIVFWRIWNLFHEKCSQSGGTRTHKFWNIVLCPNYSNHMWLGLIWMQLNYWPNTCSLLKGCGFESRYSQIYFLFECLIWD